MAGLLLLGGTVALYSPLREAGFVNYDDPGYVYENARVAAGWTWDGVAWAFRSFEKANWHPVTWLSHMTDVELFGMDPGRHHVVSVLFHAVNAVLLFAFLLRATRAPGPSFFVAAAFAVHPLHVESVAWISERKDVLSALFWMATLHAYLSWIRARGAALRLAVVLLLGLGLLAKPMVVTLPCVLLLLDVWPLGRAWRRGEETATAWRARLVGLVREKLPLFALVAAASAVTLVAQKEGGAVVATPALSVGARLANAVVAYVWYLEKAVWPSGLAVFYPHPFLGGAGAPPAGAVVVPLALLLAITALAIGQARRRPWLLVGWLWYLGTLVPVIGLVQVGAQATADRYSYLPLVGPFISVAWAGAELATTANRRRVVVLVAAVYLLACAAVTRAQLVHWKSARALAERSVAVSPDSFVMHYNLALALESEGDLEGARRAYEEALRIAPEQVSFYANLGQVLGRLGRWDDASRRYRQALEMSPRAFGAANNLAWLRATHPDPARRNGAEAVRLAETALLAAGAPSAQILDTLAAAQAEAGDFRAALRTARRAARLAREEGDAGLASAVEARARGYAAGRPHREGLAPPP